MINYRFQRYTHGFTLIEVMVALIIFAVLSVTLLTRLGDNIRAEQYLESKTFAGVIAENTLAELRIKEEWSAVSNRTETVNMAGQDWQVKTVVSNTPNENLKRVDVQVGPENRHSSDSNAILTLTSFIGRY